MDRRTVACWPLATTRIRASPMCKSARAASMATTPSPRKRRTAVSWLSRVPQAQAASYCASARAASRTTSFRLSIARVEGPSSLAGCRHPFSASTSLALSSPTAALTAHLCSSPTTEEYSSQVVLCFATSRACLSLLGPPTLFTCCQHLRGTTSPPLRIAQSCGGPALLCHRATRYVVQTISTSTQLRRRKPV